MQPDYYLDRCLQLANQYRGQCAPNPAVGAMIVHNQQIIAEGAHRGPGQAHAEVDAFNQANGPLDDASLYVSLEPCSHTGHTPPCTEAIIRSGIKHVVYAVADPNPKVDGMRALQAAGIHVEQIDHPATKDFYRSYVKWQHTDLASITAKIAVSLDGKIAGPKRERLAISGAHMHLITHQQRLKSDGLLTTVQTVLQDNPQLNCRMPNQTVNKPVYLIDAVLEIPQHAQLFNTSAQLTILYNPKLATPNDWLTQTDAILLPFVFDEDRVDLQALQQMLGKVGYHDIWLESGGTFLAACLDAKIIEACHVALCNRVFSPKHHSAQLPTLQLEARAQQISWQALALDEGFLATFKDLC